MQLPTIQDINSVPGDLDGQTAVRNFHGKSLDQAEALFRESSITYQEDLLFMGAPAFRFYVLAAISYIRSEAAADDSDIVNCFASILEQRLEFETEELVAVAPQLASICRYILEHYDCFTLTPEIYGDLRPRYQSLEQAFLKRIHT